MSAYANDSRVEIGLYEAYVSGPHGPKYVYAGAGLYDWVVAPAFVGIELRAAAARGDMDAISSINAENSHFPTFDDAIRSVIGDPQ